LLIRGILPPHLMDYKYAKAQKISLAEAGHDEKWLQQIINDDPAILGLGELDVVRREKKQSAGGRIDFLMSDEEETMYEVEVMLGQLDESHIIRTIEYWDNERRRYPAREHCAVIVAEGITNRFFNVIALFNRAIPIIAIQLSCIVVDSKLVLDFTKVLDIYENPIEEDESEGESTDKSWWEKRSSTASVAIVDQLAASLANGAKAPKLTYNRGHIAMGGVQKNFAWFHPRVSHCHFHCRCEEKDQNEVIEKMQSAGVIVTSQKRNSIKGSITPETMRKHSEGIAAAFKLASRYGGGLHMASAAKA
jgi:hypothetical protein